MCGSLMSDGRIPQLTKGVGNYKELESEPPRQRAGGVPRGSSDKWQSAKFGEGISEGLNIVTKMHTDSSCEAASESDVMSFFKDKPNRIFGIGKLGDLLSVIAIGTMAGYVSAWEHWFQFTIRSPDKRWTAEISPKWGETLVDGILFETRVLGCKKEQFGVNYPDFGTGMCYPAFQIGASGQGAINEYFAL